MTVMNNNKAVILLWAMVGVVMMTSPSVMGANYGACGNTGESYSTFNGLGWARPG